MERLGGALAGAGLTVALLVATPAVAEEWRVSCRVSERIVFAEDMDETLVERSVEGVRRSFPGATCIASSLHVPVPEVPAGAANDLEAAIAALQGISAGTESIASPAPMEALESRPEVHVEPPIAKGHLRLASYRGVPLEVVLADWERMVAILPVMQGSVPRITTLGDRTLLDVGPFDRVGQAQACLLLSEDGVACRRGPGLATVSVTDLWPDLPSPEFRCGTFLSVEPVCEAAWRRNRDMPVLTARLPPSLADVGVASEASARDVPVPTPRPDASVRSGS